jgi:hypothetical protein
MSHAEFLLRNGGFEANGGVGTTVFDHWTSANASDTAGTGSFYVQQDTSSPINQFSVLAPPEALSAAMTDSIDIGTHVLYQDFVVPLDLIGASLSFQVFMNNQADKYFVPGLGDNPGDPSLAYDFTQGSNQQARIDIMTTSADIFSVKPDDILMNLFQTNPGDPLLSGYNMIVPNNTDLTTMLLGHLGETLRFRIAEVDNQNYFNFGVDDIQLNAVPEPSSLILVSVGALSLAYLARSRIRKQTASASDDSR